MGTPVSGVQICGSLPTHANIATTILAALADVRVARPDLADWCERVPAVAPLFATAPYAKSWAELPAATAGTAALLSAWRAAGQAEPQPAALAALEAARALLAQKPLAWPAQPAQAGLLARCLAGLCAEPATVARALAAAGADAALAEALDEPAMRALSAASLLSDLAPAALPALLRAASAAGHPARPAILDAAHKAGLANPALAGALTDALLPHDPSAAGALAEALANAAPAQLGPRLALGRAYRAAGRNAEASKLLAQVLQEIDITAAAAAADLAEAEAAQGREPEARRAWARALARDPQHTRAALNLARQARQSGRTTRAERALLAAVARTQAADLPGLLPELYVAGMDAALTDAIERAAAALPDDPRVVYYAGLLRERSGALPEAEAAFAHAAVLAPRWHAPHAAIARTLHARGDLPAAAAGFEQALRREPSSAEALAGLSRVRADQGDRPAAITLAQALVQTAPESAEHHALLADLLLADGRAAEALPAAQAAAERVPNAHHLVRLATAQRATGAHADALGTLRDAQERLGDHPQILPLLADGAASLGDWPTALEAYSAQFLQLRDAGSARGAAAAARGYGDMVLARAWLARALRCDPADTQSWLEVAALGRDTNRPHAAIRAYKRALALGAPASSQCELAQAYAQAGELAAAQGCAEDYLKQAPEDTAGWLLLGQLRARQGDRAGALSAAERLADLPELPAAAACWLIDTLATAGLRGRARTAADEAVAAHPHDAGLRTRRAGLLAEAGLLADARADALAALACQPDLASARLILARVQLRERAYAAAQATLAPLAEDSQHAAVVSPLLAEALEGCGQPAEALPHAVRALQQSRADRERIARVARLLLATGQAAHAAVLLQPVADKADLLILRAQAHAAGGNYAEARRDAEAGLKLAPDNADLAWAATAVLTAGAAPALAQRQWLELAERFPGSQAIRHSAAQAALAAGDANAALVALRPLLAHGAANAETALLLGRAYVGAGRVQDAIRTLRYAMTHIADQALRSEARLALAEAYLALGWADDARATLDAALAETPAHAQARRMRAQLALAAGQLNDAAADLGAISDESPEAAELQATLAARQGDWTRALAEQRRACALAPTTAHLARLAELGAQAGDTAAQIEALEALTERAPESAHWAALARAYTTAHELGRAGAAWRNALGAGAPAAWWAEYGGLLERAGEIVAAQRAYAQALTIDSTDAASAAALANLSAVPAERVELLRLATHNAPHHAAHWRSLAKALAASGAQAEERQALQRAWALTPDDHALAGDYAEALIAGGERQTAIDVLTSNCALPSAPAALLGRLAGLLTEALPFVGDLVRLPAGADLARQRLTAPAEALLAEARARDAAAPAWWLQAARLRVTAGDYPGALALLGDLDATTLSETDAAEARVLRAAALARTGALAEAAELAREATQSPEAAAMHTILAEAAHAAANPAEVRTHAQAARQAGADSPQLLALWGLAALALCLPAEACEALELALEQASEPAWLEALSRAYAQLGRRERALNYAARAVRAAPEVAAFQHQLATLYQQQHQLHDARAALMRALSLEPDVPAWHAQMAEICTALGMAQAASQSLARARALAADDPEIMVVGARLRASEGDAIAALACYRQAIEQAPERVEWLVAAAQLARDSKQAGEFVRYAYAAVERAPGQAEHWLLLAEAVELTRDQPAAFVVLEQGLEHCRNDRTLVLPATRLALALDHPAKAQALIDGWLDQSPDDAEAWELAGVVAQRLNEGDVAQRALERAVMIVPRRASAHAALARLALARELPDQALRAAANASDYDPINRSHNVLLARALQCAGRLDEARAVIRPILPADLPLEADVVRWYAELQLADGDPERAIAALDLAIEQMPALPELHLWAGRAHRQLRHYRRAITHLRRAIRLRPSYPEAIIELSSLGPLAFAAHAAQSDEFLSERTA